MIVTGMIMIMMMIWSDTTKTAIIHLKVNLFVAVAVACDFPVYVY